jgi:hypothetical protein
LAGDPTVLGWFLGKTSRVQLEEFVGFAAGSDDPDAECEEEKAEEEEECEEEEEECKEGEEEEEREVLAEEKAKGGTVRLWALLAAVDAGFCAAHSSVEAVRALGRLPIAVLDGVHLSLAESWAAGMQEVFLHGGEVPHAPPGFVEHARAVARGKPGALKAVRSTIDERIRAGAAPDSVWSVFNLRELHSPGPRRVQGVHGPSCADFPPPCAATMGSGFANFYVLEDILLMGAFEWVQLLCFGGKGVVRLAHALKYAIVMGTGARVVAVLLSAGADLKRAAHCTIKHWGRNTVHGARVSDGERASGGRANTRRWRR